MKHELPHLINIPPFLLRAKNTNNLFSTLLVLIQGKLSTFIIKNFKGKLFCNLLKIIFPTYEKILFKNNKYYKNLNIQEICFPNKRILRIYLDPLKHFDRLFNSYCLDKVSINTNDVIIDCGANVGELNIALKLKNLNVNYYAFEPDYSNFICLLENNKENADNIFDSGLSNKNGTSKFYLDNDGGNSSFYSFGTKEYTNVSTLMLDDVTLPKNIKLLKVEAEGFEPEVIEGAVETLKRTEYICVDFGSERGVEQENTVIEVNNILLKNNFALIEFSDYRYIGLYKNTKLDE